MRSNYWRVLTGLFLIGVLFFGMTVPADADPASDLRRAQEEQRRTQRQMQEIQRRKSETENRQRRLAEELRQAEDRLYQVRNDLASLEVQLAETEQQTRATVEELRRAEDKLEQRGRLLNTRVRVIHEMGTVSLLQVLMDSTDFRDFVTRFDLLKNIVTKDVELFNQVRLIRDEINAKKTQLEDRRARIASFKSQSEAKRQEVQQVVNVVWDKKQETLRDLDLLERQEDQLQSISKELESRIFDLQRQMSFKRVGRLAFQWPVRGPISSPFGMR